MDATKSFDIINTCTCVLSMFKGGTSTLKVMERVTDDFLKYTYNRLKEIDGRKMCVEPWPPTKSASADGFKLVGHLIISCEYYS